LDSSALEQLRLSGLGSSGLLSHAQLQQLSLCITAQDEPELVVRKPTLRLSRSCRSLIPPLGWPRLCKQLGAGAGCQRPVSAETRRTDRSRASTELSQWDLSQTAAESVKAYLALVTDKTSGAEHRISPRPRTKDGVDDANWAKALFEGGENMPVEGPPDGRLHIRSRIGRYSVEGRAASPIKKVREDNEELLRMLDELTRLGGDGGKTPEELLTMDKATLERQLKVLRERKRRKGAWTWHRRGRKGAHLYLINSSSCPSLLIDRRQGAEAAGDGG
jgi:hypothetical protein